MNLKAIFPFSVEWDSSVLGVNSTLYVSCHNSYTGFGFSLVADFIISFILLAALLPFQYKWLNMMCVFIDLKMLFTRSNNNRFSPTL